MDIHRCRFVPYPPSTINALAFSHSHISKDEKTAPPRLAVGRANGDVEIWNPLKGSWLQESIIRGGKDRSIDGLVWIQDPTEDAYGKTIIGKSRLFSVGYTTTVTEWDLTKGKPLRQASGNHGEIWCIAAQPSIASARETTNGVSTGQWPGQSLVTGCTDGALVLYSTKDDNLQLQRVLVRPSAKKAKIISVVFQNRNIVVAGCTDSTIRIYDIRNGSLLRSMTLGSGPKGGPKEIIVWSVKVLKDGTIVSGDSTGEVKIWDGKLYTLSQRIKSHKQDVLSLAVNYDGSAIFSGGMDRRTVVYKAVGRGKPRWAEVAHRRFHSHDVKTMASFEGGDLSVIVSGGPDASPTVVPLGQYGFENQRSLPFFPQEALVQSAPKARLVMSWWNREIHIWRLEKHSSLEVEDGDSESRPINHGRKLVAKILIKGEANITSASLSTDGNVLSVSTASEIKLFQLRPKQTEDSLRVTKVSLPKGFPLGARLIQFSPDSKWLCVIRSDSSITLARILVPNPSAASSIRIHPQLLKLKRLDRRIEKHILLGDLGTYDRTITQIAFSSDSRILAVSDLAGYIDTFILSGHEDLTVPTTENDAEAASPSSSSSDSESDTDSENGEDSNPKIICGQRWTRNPSAPVLPKLPSAPVVLSFRPATQQVVTNGATPHATRKTPNPIPHDLPAGEDRLLVVTSTTEFFELEVMKGTLSPWSRRNPTSAFPETFRKTLEQVRGVLWDVSAETQRERVWVYSVGWLWMFDLGRDFPPELEVVNGTTTENGKKRKRSTGKNKTSGAGGAIPEEKLGMGISRKMTKVVHEELFEEQALLGDTMDVDSAEDENPSSGLERLPRGGETDGQLRNGDAVEEGEKPQHWHTFKYRPIMGVVVVDNTGVDKATGLEVAVVERPIWETELGSRFYGEQEWRDREVGI